MSLDWRRHCGWCEHFLRLWSSLSWKRNFLKLNSSKLLCVFVCSICLCSNDDAVVKYINGQAVTISWWHLQDLLECCIWYFTRLTEHLFKGTIHPKISWTNRLLTFNSRGTWNKLFHSTCLWSLESHAKLWHVRKHFLPSKQKCWKS